MQNHETKFHRKIENFARSLKVNEDINGARFIDSFQKPNFFFVPLA